MKTTRHQVAPDIEVIHIDPGNSVICDYCNKDWTDSPESGGLLFQSKAVCPDCELDTLKSINHYNEQKFIRGHCPENQSFADWIREIR